MNIIGFNFTKIGAERKRPAAGKVSINNNITLHDVKPAQIGVGGGESQAVRVTFTFRSEFQPEVGTLHLEGELLGISPRSEADQTLAGWDKDKSLPTGVAQVVMNQILDRCNIQALLLAKDLNLPSPIPLPKINASTAPAQAPAADAKKADAKDDKKKKK